MEASYLRAHLQIGVTLSGCPVSLIRLWPGFEPGALWDSLASRAHVVSLYLSEILLIQNYLSSFLTSNASLCK